VLDRPDPFRSVARALLAVLADEGRPMSLRELEQDGRLTAPEAAHQLSVARVAGFVRAAPPLGRAPEPRYQPTALGMQIARRARRDTGPPAR
jgi:hypothetical protein